MRSSRFAISVAAALALALPLTRATGQQATSTVPQVITAGRGEVDIKPDRVRMEFGVETRAASAAAAAAENSRRQRAVLDTLLKLGVGQDQIQTANLQVTPEMVYPGQGQPPKVSGRDMWPETRYALRCSSLNRQECWLMPRWRRVPPTSWDYSSIRRGRQKLAGRPW